MKKESSKIVLASIASFIQGQEFDLKYNQGDAWDL